MISLAGLFLTGIDVFSGVAIGTILVVGVSVLGSLTFLPALLSLLGKATDRGRIPFLGRRRAAARHPGSGAWSSGRWCAGRWRLAGWRRWRCWRWPRRCCRCAWRIPDPRVAQERAGGPHRHDRAGLPRRPEPAEVVVTGDNLTGAGVSHAITALHARSRRPTGRSGSRSPPSRSGRRVLVISVPLTGSGTDLMSVNALGTLDTQALPATLGKVPGISYSWPG